MNDAIDTSTAPDAAASAAINQVETAVDTQASKALSVLEADAIEFIRAAARHAGEALPLLTGELGDGLNSLLALAKALAAKHGFAL